MPSLRDDRLLPLEIAAFVENLILSKVLEVTTLNVKNVLSSTYPYHPALNDCLWLAWYYYYNVEIK